MVVLMLSVALMVLFGFGVATRPDRAGFLVAATLALDSKALSVLERSLMPPLPPSCVGRGRRDGLHAGIDVPRRMECCFKRHWLHPSIATSGAKHRASMLTEGPEPKETCED